MKKSDAAAIGIGGITAVLGITAAVLCPLAGFAGGAYYVATAAAAANMGTGAIWALGAAGAVGGGFIGQIAAPFVGMAALGLGAIAGGVTKLAGAGIGSLIKLVKGKASSSAPISESKISKKLKGIFKPLSAKPDFDAAATPVNDNAVQPAAKPAPSIKPAI